MTATAVVSNLQPPPNPAGPGNSRALRHGTSSETTIAPVRQQKAQDLAARYPHVDPDLIAVQAHRLAQIELAAQYLDEKGGIVRDHRMGRVYDVADKLMTWSRTAERWIEAREAEARERAQDPARVHADFKAEVARIVAAREPEHAVVDGDVVEGEEDA